MDYNEYVNESCNLHLFASYVDGTPSDSARYYGEALDGLPGWGAIGEGDLRIKKN